MASMKNLLKLVIAAVVLVALTVGTTQAAAANLKFSPDPLDFDEGQYLYTVVGKSKTLALKVTNNTGGPLDFEVDCGSGPFSCQSGPWHMDFGTSVTIPVTFTPTNGGYVSQYAVFTETITNNELGRVLMEGTGQLKPIIEGDPPNLDFGKVRLNHTKVVHVTLKNSSTVTAKGIVPECYVYPAENGAFQCGTPPTDIEPGGSIDVQVEFTPTSRGTFLGHIAAASDEPVEYDHVGLQGKDCVKRHHLRC